MRRKKRISVAQSLRQLSQSILLALLLVVLSSMSQAEISGDYEYTDNSDGTCTITGYTGLGGDVTIPETLNGLTVTDIGYGVFYNNMALTSVVISDTVITIGEEAFAACELLNYVTIGNSVTTLRRAAFSGCDGLVSVTIPHSVVTIGDLAFAYCSSLTNITIGNGVYVIGTAAFMRCYDLASITIPESVTSIGDSAFYDCDSLTEINVDTLNTAYSSIAGVLFNKTQTALIRYPGGKAGAYTIPDGVVSIEYSAFSAFSLCSTQWGCGHWF